MREKGRCIDCGAVCPNCGPRDGFTLKALPENVRGLVREVLDSIGASQAHQDRLIRDIYKHEPRHIERAYRMWKEQGLKAKAMGYGYFREIVKSCARTSEAEARRLDDLPQEWT